MIINKEKKLQLYVLVGLAAVILISLFIGWKFGQTYLLIFLLVIFFASFFVLLEFYLRVQHNIDNKAIVANELRNEFRNEIKNEIIVNAENIINKINGIKQAADEINKAEIDINNKLSGERELYEEMVDFFDNILNYLDDNKKYLEDNKKEILGAEEKTNRTIEGLQTETTAEIKELKDFQNKMVVLLQQILEHQEDQVNFLKEEMEKLKK